MGQEAAIVRVLRLFFFWGEPSSRQCDKKDVGYHRQL
jgi:hypothetical protein